MVTRAGVAKRLGISIASVRRMEGHELHPWTNERGVHQFDPGEIEAVVQTVGERSESTAEGAFFQKELRESRERALRLESEVAQAREALHASLADAARLRKRSDELRETAVEALELVSVVLGPDTPYGVRSVLRTLNRQE